MVRLIAACAVLMLIGMAPVNAGQGGADSWTPREMGDPGQLKGKALKLPFLPEDRSFPAEFRCKEKASSCEFELAYFLGDGFDLSKKTASQYPLYTRRAGSYRRSKQPLRRFAPSGSEAQRSLLPPARYGQERHRRGPALRSISARRLCCERHRKTSPGTLKSRPWDAIYGHNWEP